MIYIHWQDRTRMDGHTQAQIINAAQAFKDLTHFADRLRAIPGIAGEPEFIVYEGDNHVAIQRGSASISDRVVWFSDNIEI